MRTPLIAGKLSQNDMPISSEALFKERSETITFVSRLISCKSQSKWGAPYLRGEDIVRPLRKLKAARNSGYNLTNYIEHLLERGQIKNAKKLAVSFTNAQRDTLYKNNINPIVTFPNQGTVLWGQKTMLDKSSAFNRVNIRALFNYLERSLGKMSKYSLFESNDSFLRNYLTSIIKPFLTGVKAGRGIADYLVICDDSNNTPQVVANNQLIIDIYIKPVYATEFILLRFINSGVNDFSTTIVG